MIELELTFSKRKASVEVKPMPISANRLVLPGRGEWRGIFKYNRDPAQNRILCQRNERIKAIYDEIQQETEGDARR
jgi:hypothetical protein